MAANTISPVEYRIVLPLVSRGETGDDGWQFTGGPPEPLAAQLQLLLHMGGVGCGLLNDELLKLESETELTLEDDMLLGAGEELTLEDDMLLGAGEELTLEDDMLLGAGEELTLEEDMLLGAGEELILDDTDRSFPSDIWRGVLRHAWCWVFTLFHS